MSLSEVLGQGFFFAGGKSWQCVSLVIHQGYDLLSGEQQPSEHFYVLECEGPKRRPLCYNNAVGLHYIDDTKIKAGDRICGLLFRTTDIATKWHGQIALATRKPRTSAQQKFDKNKRNKSSTWSRITFGSKKRSVSQKLSAKSSTILSKQDIPDFSPLKVTVRPLTMLPLSLVRPWMS